MDPFFVLKVFVVPNNIGVVDLFQNADLGREQGLFGDVLLVDGFDGDFKIGVCHRYCFLDDSKRTLSDDV